ncbi:domain of Kin17 curved DNA-binding protein-domain-containing protein [Cladorrhinum samala]|uniref:Domain of Kin17 curved DNA-binding protein-domain-containing protein n=1 Tax=Cladorrhinum samala TaxID=585594 RepID=A0AAV9HQ85_9PEZI|nr:domain of Kin17 curved DNA-binding protein-domain-containing protein [Cladorrhinum samala]
MGKAEVGSTKHLANKMKQKGLTRLRWYCQICEKACRDENGFKMHVQSESHTRRALEVGQNFKGAQDEFSNEFQREFVQQLKTAHGEKEIHANKFYQEIIQRRDHIHLNATKWSSLTMFIKHLAREGICRIEEKEDGIFIAWINDSPEAMKRREEARKKDLMDKGDEERELGLLKAQIERARREAEARGVDLEEDNELKELKRQEGEKIKLSFAKKSKEESPKTAETLERSSDAGATPGTTSAEADCEPTKEEDGSKPAEPAQAAKPVSLKFGAKPQPKNVFKNAFAGQPKKVMAAQPKKMSEAERIMKEELERKRAREEGGGRPFKKPRF